MIRVLFALFLLASPVLATPVTLIDGQEYFDGVDDFHVFGGLNPTITNDFTLVFDIAPAKIQSFGVSYLFSNDRMAVTYAAASRTVQVSIQTDGFPDVSLAKVTGLPLKTYSEITITVDETGGDVEVSIYRNGTLADFDDHGAGDIEAPTEPTFVGGRFNGFFTGLLRDMVLHGPWHL